MHTPHCPPPLSPAASRRGDTSTGVADANATSTSTSCSPISNSLHVPPPEHAWSGAALARALGSLAAPIDADVSDGVSEAGDLAAAAAAATPTAATPSAPALPFFSLPYNAVEGRPMLSFAALLPTPLPIVPATRHAPQECAATPSRTSHHHHQPHPQQRSSSDAAPALVRRYSNSSLPSVSASRATAPGMGVDHSAAGHAENSSQRRLRRLPVSPLSQDSPSGTHSSASSTSNSRPRRHDGRGGDSPASASVKAQKARTTAPSSFTDLFVGLERPRRYNQRQRQRQRQREREREEAQQQQQGQQLSRHPGHRRRRPTLMGGPHGDAGDALDASMSPPSSMMSSPSVSDGRRAGAPAFMHDAELSDNDGYGGLGASHDAEEEDSTLDVAEDDDGASTPTVYRSAELPHWWRSLVTPDPGTTVNLRPDTRRLEFWWIDRLGSEAYEIISIVLRHNIEGTVLRNSGDSAVVVEFRIPARVLGTSSYAVEHPSLSPSSPPPPAVVAVAAPPSPPRPSMPASGPLDADTGDMPAKEFAEPQHLQLPEEGQGEAAPAVAALPAPLPVPSPAVGHTASSSSSLATEGIAAPDAAAADAGGVGNQMETSIMSLGHMGSSHSPLASSQVTGSGDGAVGAGDNFPLPSPAVLMDESPQLPQAPRLPGLVRLSTSSHAESLGHATTPTTANTTVNTNATTATTATTMTTMVSSLAGARGVRLLSPLRNPTTPRRSETTASVATDGGDVTSRGTASPPLAPSLSVQEVCGGGNQLAAGAMSAPSSPGPHHSISLANGSNTETVAGRSTDSSAEQDVQWRALARVLDTAVSRHQSQQPSSSQHPQPHLQQQSSLSTPPIIQAASYSTDAAVAALLAATTTDGGLDGAPGAAAAAAPALRRLLRSEASLGTGDGERLDAAATSTSGRMATDVAFRLQRSPSAPQRSASPPRPHFSHPHTRTVKRLGSALASSASAAAAGGGDGAAAAAGSGTAAAPPSTAGLGFSVQSRSSQRSSTPSPMRRARGAGRDGDGSGGTAQRQQPQRLPSLTGSDTAFLVHVGPQLKARDVHVRPSSVGAATAASAPAPPVVSVSLGDTASDNNCLSIVSRQPSSEVSPRVHRQLRAVQPHPWAAHRQLPHVTAQSAQTHLPPVYRHHQHPLGNSTSTSVSTNVDATAEAAATAAAAARLDNSTSADASANVPLPEFLRSKLSDATPPPTTQLDADDDSVVAVLTLPASVCTPIVVVRLHAMGVLHPLLRALALPHGPGLRSASTSEDPRAADEGDSDGLEEALVTAAHRTRLSPPSSFGEESIDSAAAAVRILSKAISELVARPAAGTSADAAAPEEMEGDEEEHAAALGLRAPSRGRDLSILYTVRSHVFFHGSAASLRSSLQDAEAALRCCAIHSRINATYEILGANLICFGYAAQVEGLAGHLRHRWRFASPLLVRFGRVTQVMMTYAAMFLRQQLPHSMLRLCSGGNGFAAPTHSNASSIVGLVGGGGGFAGASFMTMSVSAYSPRGAGDANGAGTLSDAGMGSLSTTPHAPAALAVLSATTGLGDGRDLSGSPAAAAEASNLNAILLAHALPFEVCPLLLGHYGRTLHNAQETPSQQPLPCLTSPLSKSIDSTATTGTAAPAHKSGPHSPRRRPQRAFRPNADVCHRRLFLLETIYPSMNPIPMNRLKSVLPMPLARRFQGRRSPRSTILSSSAKTSTGSSSGYGGVGGRGRTSPAPSHAIVVPTAAAKRERKVRAEDLMYDRDSMLALLAATADTTMRWGTAPMRYFARHIRLSATRRIMKGETLLMERPALLMPFWPLLPPRPTSTTSPSAAAAAAGCGASESAKIAAPQCCAQCGRQRLARFIPCPGECGSVYCSEQCRHLALRTYHIVECSAAPPDPHDPRVQECGDDDATRMRRAAATIRDVLTDWNTYLHYLARWDTPSTRRHATPFPQAATPSSSVSAMAETPTLAAASSGEPPGGGAPGHPVSSQPPPPPSSAKLGAQCPASRTLPPPILAVTAMRAVARVGALLMCLILPVELLPQMREHPEWAAERHAMLRAVARTLRQRGLVVPATTEATRTKSGPYRDANKYCTNVDPHHLLLMEVLLQQMSIPFFADFNYRAPSTVWERLGHIPCQVEHSDADGGRLDGAAKSVFDSLRSVRMNGGCNPSAPFTPTPYPATVEQQQQHQQRNWFVELTPLQREEVLCDLHSMVSHVYMAIAEELGSVRALPHCTTSEEEAEDDESELEQGLPGRWNCVDLFGYLTSTRAFQQISDFCLTSWAVVYPRDLEPPNVAAAMAADGRGVSTAPGASAAAFPSPSATGGDRSTAGPSPPQNALGPFPNNRRSADTTTVATDLSHYSQGEASTTLAVPLVVISPWACLTVDLHPILGNVPGGVLYSRFMVEHEQRRRMLAYCAAAAGRRCGSVFGSLGGANDESFLSVNSAVSTSAAALLSGEDSLRGGVSLREDGDLKLLEEAAQRSCSNLHFSLVYTPSNEVALVVSAKKNINLGDVLWWESVSCGEYLAALL